MKKKNYDFDVVLEDGREFQTNFTYTPGKPATKYDHNGDPGDPEQDAEIEFNWILDENGNDVFEDLDEHDLEAIQQKIFTNWEPGETT